MTDVRTWLARIDRRIVVAGLAIVVIGLLIILPDVLPVGIDWRDDFRPAARALMFTGTPYSVPIFINAPWTLLPLLPFALLPEKIGGAALFLIGLGAFAYSAYRLGAKPLVMMAFLLSPPVIHCLLNGNLDWMALLGMVLPPPIGLILIATKPQMGSVVAIFWLFEAWRNGGWRQVVRTFWPITAVLAISFLLFGFWPARFTLATTLWWNASLWPASIPVGLALAVAAIRRRDIRYAMAASPCLSPYVLLHSWSGAVAALLAAPLEFFAAWIGLWALVVIRAGAL